MAIPRRDVKPPVFLTSTFVFGSAEEGRDFFDYASGRKRPPEGSGADCAGLELARGDISEAIVALPGDSVDAILHDPPRFGIAGELYSQVFYDQLARVLRRGGRLFHYTGSPNTLTSGRDVPREVAKRLETAGFKAEPALDGVFGIRR